MSGEVDAIVGDNGLNLLINNGLFLTAVLINITSPSSQPPSAAVTCTPPQRPCARCSRSAYIHKVPLAYHSHNVPDQHDRAAVSDPGTAAPHQEGLGRQCCKACWHRSISCCLCLHTCMSSSDLNINNVITVRLDRLLTTPAAVSQRTVPARRRLTWS